MKLVSKNTVVGESPLTFFGRRGDIRAVIILQNDLYEAVVRRSRMVMAGGVVPGGLLD